MTLKPSASLQWPATEIEMLREAMREAQPFCMTEGAKILRDAEQYAAKDFAKDRAENEHIGCSLDDLISAYGMARTDGANDLDRQYRWKKLISGIKQYAAQEVAAEREKCAGECESEASMWEADGRGVAIEARLCAARIRARPDPAF